MLGLSGGVEESNTILCHFGRGRLTHFGLFRDRNTSFRSLSFKAFRPFWGRPVAIKLSHFLEPLLEVPLVFRLLGLLRHRGLLVAAFVVRAPKFPPNLKPPPAGVSVLGTKPVGPDDGPWRSTLSSIAQSPEDGNRC